MRIFVLLASLFFPFLAFAQSILIHEIAWMGTPVQGVEEKQWWRYEWLELYNTKDYPLQVDDWKIELWRDPSTPSTPSTSSGQASSGQAGSGQANLDFAVSLKGTIVPHGYYVAGASEKIPNLDFNYKNLGAKFFNGGQKVVLKNSLGEVMDGIDAQNGWPAGDNKTKQTMERVGGLDPTTIWQTSKEPGGTPKALNSEGPTEAELSLIKFEAKLNQTKPFQSRVPVVNPITLLAGFLALGFSGIMLLAKRYLALRLRSGQALRQRSSTEAHSKSREV